MKEPQPKHVYLPIPPQMIESLEGKSDKQLRELDVSLAILGLIKQGLIPQLEENTLNTLSHALGLDT